jgi:hypothetical protein
MALGELTVAVMVASTVIVGAVIYVSDGVICRGFFVRDGIVFMLAMVVTFKAFDHGTIRVVEEFADIHAWPQSSLFLGVWTLESTKDKIIEMCRLVNLGEMIKQFAAQIKTLLMSIIVLMRAAIDKFKNIDLADAMDDAVEQVADMVGNVCDSIKKLKFWEK